jgi:hypothetical protein
LKVIENRLVTYPAPVEAVENSDFKVRVRLAQGEWQELFCYNVKVDMHDVRNASMVYFDCSGPVDVEVIKNTWEVEEAVIRPLSFGLECAYSGNRVTFMLDGPRKISLEVNGDRFHNLHIFANPLEENVPDPTNPDVIYFGPGMHVLKEPQMRIPSGKTVYIAGGAVVVGALVCEHVQDVTIRGRGLLYMSDFEKTTYYRGVEISFSRDITVEGIITIDPPHYTILIGQSEHISIRNIKTFSTRGWSDGIDMMSCSHIEIEDVFLRTSDDCIAIYGQRGDFYGDSLNVTVRNSILWADVAHPMNIGTHGDSENGGNIIENIVFENIDILEHHEPQRDYWGCMAINPGDNNTVRNIRYENIRVEQFELGELFNIRVVHNPKYNPQPGKRVENILFKDIVFNGICENPSRIEGFDETRIVDGVTFENVFVNGRQLELDLGDILIGSYVNNVKIMFNY